MELVINEMLKRVKKGHTKKANTPLLGFFATECEITQPSRFMTKPEPSNHRYFLSVQEHKANL